MSAFGGKADIALCTAHVLLTQSGHYLFLQPALPVCSFDDDTIPCLEPHGAHPERRELITLLGGAAVARSWGRGVHVHGAIDRLFGAADELAVPARPTRIVTPVVG